MHGILHLTMKHLCKVPLGSYSLLRNLKGIKQDEAAKKLGVRQQAISKLEKCKNISSQKFDAIIAVFKFSAEDIETAKRFLPPP